MMNLLVSDDRGERVFVVDSVTQLIWGGRDSGTCLTRKFVPLSQSFQAVTVTELIDWGTTSLTKPVLTAFLSSEELQACMDAPLRVPETWQCHPQGIKERPRRSLKPARWWSTKGSDQPGSGALKSAAGPSVGWKQRQISWPSLSCE